MKIRKHIVYIILFLSVLFNVICVLPYKGYFISRLEKIIYPQDYILLTEMIPDSFYKELVLNKSMQMDGSNYSTREYHGLPQDIKDLYYRNKSHNETLDNPFNMGYLYAGLSYYALYSQKSKKKIVDYLINVSERFENSTHDSLRYRIDNIVQIPYGLMYINLYKITKNRKYLNISSSIYKQLLLLRLDGSNEIPYISNSDYRYVDGLGMFVPFLVEYYNLTGDTLSKKIAKDNIGIIQKYCVDEATGVPTHGYNPNTHLKLGSSNWGRGIGWYLLALSYFRDMADKQIENTIANLDYSQFPGQPYGDFDTSTALMFEIFKQSRSSKRKANISVLKSHTTESGMITDCSGDTDSYNRYSHTFCKSELCNGLFLILISKFANNKQ